MLPTELVPLRALERGVTGMLFSPSTSTLLSTFVYHPTEQDVPQVVRLAQVGRMLVLGLEVPTSWTRRYHRVPFELRATSGPPTFRFTGQYFQQVDRVLQPHGVVAV